jgi:hypothetical protein
MKSAVSQDKDAKEADRKKLKRLIAKLEKTTNDAREVENTQLKERIKELETDISDLRMILAFPEGLSPSAKRDLRNTLKSKTAQLALLRVKLGTDFRGLLNVREIKKIARLIKEAKKEVEKKKRAAALASAALKIADAALTILGKLPT